MVIGIIAFLVIRSRSQQSNITFNASLPNEAKQEEDSESVEDQQTNQSQNSNASQTTNSNSYELSIEKIGVIAPITVGVDGNNKNDYLKALESGIAHMKNTALPGSIGNSVIFGHSSYYANKPGSYKNVFAKLNGLTIGDILKISKEGKVYNYKVIEKQIIGSKDLSVLNSSNQAQELTILTCWPVGTIDQRLAIKATII